MKSRIVSTARILTFALVLSLFGCGPGHSAGMGGFSIGSTQGDICTFNDRVALVVWVDAMGLGHGGGSSSGQPTFEGHSLFADGRKVVWTCSTRDGKNGIVTVDGVRHDLAQGSVFLISTKGGITKVEQLPIDLGALAPGGF